MLNTHFNGKASASQQPAAPPTANFIDAISEDERRLAMELAELLSRRPQDATAMRASIPNAPQPSGIDVPDHDGSFAWKPDVPVTEAVNDEFSGEVDLARGIVPASTLQWLNKARQQRHRAKVRSAGAWLVSLMIAGAIIAVAAYVLLGRVPGLFA